MKEILSRLFLKKTTVGRSLCPRCNKEKMLINGRCVDCNTEAIFGKGRGVEKPGSVRWGEL